MKRQVHSCFVAWQRRGEEAQKQTWRAAWQRPKGRHEWLSAKQRRSARQTQLCSDARQDPAANWQMQSCSAERQSASGLNSQTHSCAWAWHAACEYWQTQTCAADRHSFSCAHTQPWRLARQRRKMLVLHTHLCSAARHLQRRPNAWKQAQACWSARHAAGPASAHTHACHAL